jgi:Cu(I)/Ag(I) efflux system periplasmic protein CusF
MKRRRLAMVLALALWAVPQTGYTQSLIDGQIMEVDASAGKITIKHGPIRKLGMDVGMTMVFTAQNPGMLKTVKAGDKVRFDADEVNGQFTVTKIVKAK